MSEIWFGLPAPAGAKRAWGARAIYRLGDRSPLDFLPDRQSVSGKIPKKLFKSLVAEMRRSVSKNHLASDEMIEIQGTSRHPGWFFAFSPRGSCGYLYCLIWEV